jgi:hypothetical protein
MKAQVKAKMKLSVALAGLAVAGGWWLGAVGGAGALAQGAPESLLPPGFDRPSRPARPAASPSAAPVASPAARVLQPRFDGLGNDAPTASPTPVGALAPVLAAVAKGPVALPEGINSFDQLMALPPEKLDRMLGLIPKYDIPPGAQRALRHIGLLDEGEHGMPAQSLAGQNASLVRAAVAGNAGQMVSRWGHILLRRALASRLDAPDGMAPTEFAALRASLLLRMGEQDTARALVQDVDPSLYDAALAQAAWHSYIATADLTGFCPVLQSQPSLRQDAEWQAMRGICATFGGASASGMGELDRMAAAKSAPRIDILLAQKYAGASGSGNRRTVNVEWEGVTTMTPMRYALTIALGIAPPETAMKESGGRFSAVNALAPMLGLGLRADASDGAAAHGVLSSAAMVDLYAQVYNNDDVKGGPADRALLLRDAYVGITPADRLTAIQQLWDGAQGNARYGRMVLTAYAAARLTPSADMAGAAGDLIASMLAAGLDGNAAMWRSVVELGSDGWAQLAVAMPVTQKVDVAAIETFIDRDKSENKHRSAMLVAGLSGLGRLDDSARADLLKKLSASVDGRSRWSDAIDQAANVGNPTLVALLAGLGMQGDAWSRMTPRYLMHIVSALQRVGLGAEARMIAAEAVARG